MQACIYQLNYVVEWFFVIPNGPGIPKSVQNKLWLTKIEPGGNVVAQDFGAQFKIELPVI
jgi:hypothetical protein